MMEQNPSISIRQILRKKMYPYKPKNVQPLTEAHKQGRIKFCQWLLDQKVRPNNQNER